MTIPEAGLFQDDAAFSGKGGTASGARSLKMSRICAGTKSEPPRWPRRICWPGSTGPDRGEASEVQPTGMVTFLFTDIEASTSRWENDAVAMGAELAAHDEEWRSMIAGHGGIVFKHTGDGVCAAFGLAQDTVAAAVEAQRSLRLPVRVGIATGAAEPRGGDYFGRPLNRAARVMAAGHGGQIFVAASTAAGAAMERQPDVGRLAQPHPLLPTR
jgi:class 3 adenylate cyclase